MKHLSHIPLILLMLWTSAMSYATNSVDVRYDYNSQAQGSYTNPKASYLHTTIGIGVEFLDEDAISVAMRSKAHICALALSIPDIVIALTDFLKTSRKLRTDFSDFDIRQVGYELRHERAMIDLAGFDEARNFVRTNPKGMDAWELLVGLPDDKKWVRTNKELLEKMSNSDIVEQNFVNLFYTTFRPQIFNPLPPTWINGIYFNKFGFPDFTVHAPHLPDGSRSLFKNTDHPDGYFDGGSSDMVAANNWALNKYGSGNFEKLSNGQCKIKIGNDWVLHTWHHHEDGLSMFPVPHSVHSSVQHTDGASVIDKNLQGFFNGPNF